eukprot:115719_1
MTNKYEASYTWKIPSLSIQSKEIICAGYIRQNYDKYITPPIIRLFAEYYTNDPFTIYNIKNSDERENFVSPIFSIKSFDWYLELFSNGSNDLNAGQTVLYICLAALPPKVSMITAMFKLSLLETNCSFEYESTFQEDGGYYGWHRDTLLFKDIQNLSQFTFTLDINILDVLNKSQVSIIDQYKNIPLYKHIIPTTATYEWIIDNDKDIKRVQTAHVGEYINGPIRNLGPFIFYVEFDPKGREKYDNDEAWIGILACYWPPKLSKILIECKMLFYDFYASNVGRICFDKDHLCFGWCTGIKYKQIQKLNKVTFYFEVSVIEMFDENENSIDCDETYNTFNTINDYTLPTAIYDWNITNKDMVNKIKNTPNVYGYESKIFSAFGLKWYIEFWPNGSRKSREGTMNIFLTLIGYVENDLGFAARICFEWLESGHMYTKYNTLKQNTNADGETHWPLKTKDTMHLNSFHIRVGISLLAVIQNNRIITGKYVNYKQFNKCNRVPIEIINIKKECFAWNINNNVLNILNEFKQGQVYKSERFKLHSMEGCLMLYPNGKEANSKGWADLFINLLELKTETTVISMRYEVSVIQTGTRYIGSVMFDKDHLDVSWGPERISFKQFQTLDCIEFQLEMELVDCYDILDNKMDNIYDIMLSNIDMLDHMIHTAKILRNDEILLSDHEQKELMDDKMDIEIMDLRYWLSHEVHLFQYYDLFVTNGFNQLDMVKMMSVSDLKDIGIMDNCHLIEIMIHIAMLTVNNE